MWVIIQSTIQASAHVIIYLHYTTSNITPGIPHPNGSHLIISDDLKLLEEKLERRIPTGYIIINGRAQATQKFCEAVQRGKPVFVFKVLYFYPRISRIYLMLLMLFYSYLFVRFVRFVLKRQLLHSTHSRLWPHSKIRFFVLSDLIFKFLLFRFTNILL